MGKMGPFPLAASRSSSLPCYRLLLPALSFFFVASVIPSECHSAISQCYFLRYARHPRCVPRHGPCYRLFDILPSTKCYCQFAIHIVRPAIGLALPLCYFGMPRTIAALVAIPAKSSALSRALRR
ncbi:hypothetical protein H4582DRAFT_1950446 [Lactarius indigo]|nr:hypothetical protein H4582DRAFT_1950446 [Lactarius indigo]